jgi:hypothetical protein
MQPMHKTNPLPRHSRDYFSFFVCLFCFLSVSVVAQSSSAPRTAWGDPDLQGLWNHGTITPLERPADYGDRELLTDEEVAALNLASETRATSERRSSLTREEDVALAYNQFWWDRGISVGRTSLITTPQNGRLPPRTLAAEAYSATDDAQRLQAAKRGRVPAHGPEDMDLGDRCLVYRPVPITSSGYNNHVHVLQSSGYVVIFQEQIHDVRIIPVSDQPVLPDQMRQWLGVSRGRWDGDTLVVETNNFYEQADYLGSNVNRRVTERFTRVAEDVIEYAFTVDDPTVWTEPWSGMVPWRPAEGPLFEYACHEGNYGMTNLLTSSRAEEEK